MLEDEVNRTVVLVDRLLKELSEDIQRQTNFVAIKRSNMNTLSASIKTGEIMGASLTNRALTAATSGVGATASRVLGSTLGRRPLVVIRFDRKDVAYDQAIYNAVSRTLESRPGATFTLVAVAPNTGGSAKIALNRNRLAGMQKMFFAHCSGWDCRYSGSPYQNEPDGPQAPKFIFT